MRCIVLLAARTLAGRRALAGLGCALLALLTCWMPFVAVPTGALGVAFAASARQEARRANGVVLRLATAGLLLAAGAIAASLALAMVALAGA